MISGGIRPGLRGFRDQKLHMLTTPCPAASPHAVLHCKYINEMSGTESSTSSDSEFTLDDGRDEPTFPGTARWPQVIELGGTMFCAACHKALKKGEETNHLKVKKGANRGKRTKTCIEHERGQLEKGKLERERMLVNVSTNADLRELVKIGDPMHFVAPDAISLFEEVQAIAGGASSGN